MRKNAVISLELAKDDTLGVKFYAKQYDDIKIKASVYDGLDAINIEGQEVVVFIQKPDGTMIEQMKDIEIVDNEIVINLSKQATTALGECDVEVILRDGEGETSTSTVSYVVIEKLSTAVIELIQSSNDIHHLKLIEELIERADASLLSIEADIREIQAYISTMEGNIDVECETILATLKALRDEIIEDINNEVHTLKNNAVDEISTLKDDSVDEISTLRDDSVDEISTLKDESIEEVDTIRNDAVDEIIALKDEIVDTSNKALEDAKEAVEKAEEAVLVATETLDTASNVKAEVEKLSSDICETIEYIEDSKNRAIEEIAEAVVIVEETKEQAVDTVENIKARAIESISEEEANAVARISAIEVSGVEGVDDAVKTAQKRLQELTIQCAWEVQQTSAEEKDAIGAVSSTEQRNIHEKANEQIERVENAGASIVAMVEGVDANVEEALQEIRTGISNIEGAVSTGKREIVELSNTQVDRIREEGAEVLELVANMDEITGDYIEKLNLAGLNNSNSVVSTTNSCIREIKTVTSEQKEAVRNTGNEKIEEINSILGVTKGEVEELLSTTRSEINSHRVDFAERVSTAKEEIDNLKDSSIVEMTNTKDDFVDEILGAEIALKEDFKTLRDAYIKDIDDKGQLRLDALQRMIDKIDALQFAVDAKLEVSEKRSETLEKTIENVDNKIAEIRPVLDSLNEMKNICVSLQQENAEARENIEELDFLHTESDTRIVELRRLIEEAKQYEAVVADYINSRGGNHEEINARLDALEEALAELEIPSIDHLATKEELEAKVGEVIDMIPEEVDLSPYATKEELNEAVNPLATKEELEEAINSIGTPTPGKVENVAVTNWDIPADLSIFDTLPIPDSYESVLCGKLSTYECVVAFFKKKVDKASITLNYGYGYRYLYIKDYEIAGFYYYTSGAWKAIAKSQYANYFGGSTSGDYYIKELFYHDFNIYDPQGNLWRQSYDAEIGENTVNDFNDAIVVNDYAVIQKDGEILLNSPIEDMSYTGMLEVEIADGVIKQELNTDNGITYKRFCKNGSWSNWDRCVDSNMKNDIVLANKGSFVKSISFVSTPASIAPMQPYDEYDVYPRAKHNLKYYDGSYYYNIFFFCDLTKESGKYITYIPVIGSTYGYNRIVFNNLIQNEDYAVYRTDSKTVAPTKFTNTTISTININNNNFRLYHYDFDMYNEDLSGIALYAPTEGLNDFNKASENGYYMVNMDAVDFKDVANGPDAKVEGVVSGNLEVVSGKQILTLTSHNKTYIRNIGEQWKDISANSVSKDIVSSIKVSDKELPPAFLKTLPIDERYFRQQDKKTIIIRRNETEYIALRTTRSTLKPYLTIGSTNTTFNLGNTQEYTQIDTYNTTTGKWTTSLPTSTSSYTVSCANTHFKIFHSDVDVYKTSNCTEVYQEAISIDFDVEKTMNDFNNAVEVGTYSVDINEEDVILNAPITGELKGVLVADKASKIILQTVVDVDNNSYRRIYNGTTWTDWKTI